MPLQEILDNRTLKDLKKIDEFTIYIFIEKFSIFVSEWQLPRIASMFTHSLRVGQAKIKKTSRSGLRQSFNFC